MEVQRIGYGIMLSVVSLAVLLWTGSSYAMSTGHGLEDICDGQVIDLMPDEDAGVAAEIRVEHPFLSVQRGLVVGESYKVSVPLSLSTHSAGSFLLMLTSKSFGILRALYPAKACNDSSRLLFTVTRDTVASAMFSPLEETSLNGSNISLAVAIYDEELMKFKKLAHAQFPVRNQCLRVMVGRDGRISSSDLPSRSYVCDDVFLLLTSPRNAYLELQFQVLQIGIHSNGRIVVQNSSEEEPGFVFTAKSSFEPQFLIVAKKGYLLLSLRSCLDCKFKALVTEVITFLECNSTTVAMKGSVEKWGKPITSELFLHNSCYSNLRAPEDYRILVIMQNSGKLPCLETGKAFLIVDPLKSHIDWCNSSSNIYFSQSNSLTLYWNASILQEAHHLNYIFIQPCVNRQFGEHPSGLFCSPGHPYIQTECDTSYFILVPLGYTVELVFSRLELSSESKSAFCNLNYLEVITDKFMDHRRVSARLCGNLTDVGRDVLTFRSPSNFMEVKISTLENPVASGFCGSYRAVQTNDNRTRGCEYGWTSGERFCYRVFLQPQNWSEAEKTCQEEDGHLASLTSDDISDLVDEIIKTNPFYEKSQAFWIGANDLMYENCFEWIDGQPFNYNNWFPGWPNYGGYSAQPSDDGMSHQNCVELRSVFRYPSKGEGVTDKLYWNDRDCQVNNPYVCQKMKPGVRLEQDLITACNRTIQLTSDRPRDVLTSPNFPSSYPSNLECHYDVTAPEGLHIVATFTDFVLEESNSCEYDFLKIEEPEEGNGAKLEEEDAGDEGDKHLKKCGDWESKIKLLRHVSNTNRLHMTFVSDFSHGYNGFRIELKIANRKPLGNTLCDNDMFELHGDRCYLLVKFPETSWITARQICSEARAQLVTVDSNKELTILHNLLQATYRYMSGEIFWIGAATDMNGGTWQWLDGRPLNSQKIHALRIGGGDLKGTRSCLAIQWRQLRSGGSFHWVAKNCNHPGSFICKKPAIVVPSNLNRTVTIPHGNLTSVNFPSNYVNNLHYTVKVQGATGTRIVFTFHHLDIEWQEDCLYDYVALKNNEEEEGVKFCGDRRRLDLKSDFESQSNVVYLTFHSDHSISSSGYLISYAIVDLTSCRNNHLLIPRIAHITSLRYPNGYLRGLDCRTTVVATDPDSRLLITIADLDIVSDEKCFGDYLEVYLEAPPATRKVKYCDSRVQRGTQLMAYGNEASIAFHSQLGIHFIKGLQRGYNLTVEAWNSPSLQTNVLLQESGSIFSLNFPQPSPKGINYTQRLVAPVGSRLYVRPPNITYWSNRRPASCDESGVSLWDPYAAFSNRTLWNPCLDLNNFALVEPIWSTLNILYVHSWSLDGSLPQFYFTYKVVKDEHFFNRSMLVFGYSNTVDACQPDPCKHGRCVTRGRNYTCHCSGNYTGLFCHMTWCDVNICGENGICNMTSAGYACECFGGYTGKRCQQVATACQPDPCLPNGQCSIFNGTFSCFCNLWYEGIRCEKYAFRIPYKPLSQRMLEEPFWLGLITVFTVLVIILCVYCIKRKFADKIEKFLMDEIERSKFQPSPPATRYSLSSNQPSLTPGSQSPQTNPKSLFSRIRKNSILSSTLSPNATPEKENSRTFSFDDILRRVHSSKRRPNTGRSTSSTGGGSAGNGHTSGTSGGGFNKEEPALKEEEKSRILSSLVTSSKDTSRRMSLDEFFRMSERKMQFIRKEENATGSNGPTKETSFMGGISPKRNRFSTASFSDIQSIREQSIEYMSSSDSLSGEPNTSEVRADVLPNPTLYVTEFESDEIEEDVVERDDESSSEGEESPQQSSSTTLKCSTTPSSMTLIIGGGGGGNCDGSTSVSEDQIGNDSTPEDSGPASSPVSQRKSSYLEVPHIIPSIQVFSADSDSAEESGSSSSATAVTVPKQQQQQQEKASTPSSRKTDFVQPRKYSVDLPMPKILITTNMGSCDSDEISPPRTPNPAVKSMMYLSPLTVISSSSDRTISESNLSTSGYSSISSPGLSRCNSSSPISDDVEQQHHHPNCTRKGDCQSPKKPMSHNLQVSQMTYLTVGGEKTFYFPPTIACHCQEVSSSQPPVILNTKNTLSPTVWRMPANRQSYEKSRLLAKRNSYQTTSTDDSIDDEGIGMDTIDFKIRKGEVTCATDLQFFLSTENQDAAEQEGCACGPNLVPPEASTTQIASPIDMNKPDILACSINKSNSASSFKSSPRIVTRKGEKAKKFSDKHRRSPSLSPSSTPIKDLGDTTESARSLPRNSSRTSMSGVMLSSSESDEPESVIGNRQKTQPRRQKKTHDATVPLVSSKSFGEHQKLEERSSDTTSRSESNGDSAPMDSRSVGSSSSESPPSTRDFTLPIKDTRTPILEKMSKSPLCTKHRLALEHASSFPPPRPTNVHHYHSQRNIRHGCDEKAKEDDSLDAESMIIILQPPPLHSRGNENPRNRFTFDPPSSRSNMGNVFSKTLPETSDSVDSSVPSDSEEELSQANSKRKVKNFRPLLSLPEDSSFHPTLKRQEAIAEDEMSDDSSSETTVLLRRPQTDSSNSDRSSPFLGQFRDSSSQSAEISEWETASLVNADSTRSPTDANKDLEKDLKDD